MVRSHAWPTAASVSWARRGLALYAQAWPGSGDEAQARSVTFITLVAGFLGLILSNRSLSETMLRSLTRPNRAFWWIVGGVLLLTSIVLNVPIIQALFRSAPLDLASSATCLIAGIVILLAMEGIEAAARPRARSTR
jgi:P-type Ca2+ transporter type 2C